MASNRATRDPIENEEVRIGRREVLGLVECMPAMFGFYRSRNVRSSWIKKSKNDSREF